MSSRFRKARRVAIAALCVGAAVACKREERHLGTPAELRVRTVPVRTSELQPGTALPTLGVSDAQLLGNAYSISQGQQLFEWYNCSGCHAHGGGGMGPPLIDSVWIYGSDPAQIHQTIVQGRPNGMPSFGGHIPDGQIWQLVAYVRALGGFAPKSTIPPRSDELQQMKSEP